MYPNQDKIDQEYRNSVYSSVLEQPSASMTPVHGSAPFQGLPNTFLSSNTPHVSAFRLNSKALIITVSVLSLLAVGGIGLVVLKSPKATTNPNSQYSVGTLPLNGVQGNNELLVGKLDQLTINGLLQANNTLILNPTLTPSTPVTGQIYYDSVTNQPYFYNGTKFVSLNPTTPVAGTSLGGLTGAIGLGQGLTVAGNQLGLANSFTSSLVTGLTGTANQINLSGATGNIKLSLPQDIAVTSAPTFGGLTVNGSSTTTGNHTVQGQLTVNSTSTFNGTATFDATAQPIGTELVSNGTFTGNTSGWTLGSNVTYNSGTNNVTSTYAGGDPSLSTTINTVAGNTYLLTFNISNDNDLMYVRFTNNPSVFNSDGFSNGQVTVAFKATFTGIDTISFDDYNRVIGDTWTLDNVSIKQTTSIPPALKVIGIDGTTWLSLGGDMIGNTALGDATLQYNTTGQFNTSTGSFALQANTTGSFNTATGTQALQSNTTGTYNTASGTWALQVNTTGSGNTATGVNAMYSNTTGSNNTATGFGVLPLNTTGNNNTALGGAAGQNLTTGSNNVALGFSAGNNLTTGSNNVAIGASTAFASSTADNQLQIGSGISGDLAIGTLAVKTTGSDSTSAFTVQDHNSNSVLNVDSTNSQVSIGSVTSAGSLVVNGTGNTGIPTDPELVANGTFSGSASGWTLGSDATYNSGTNSVTSTYAGGNPYVTTTFNTVSGNTYQIKFDISSANAPTIVYTNYNRGPTNGGPFYVGTTTLTFIANYTGTDTIYFDDWIYNTGDSWTLDNVSIKQMKTSPALNVIGYDGNSWLTLGNDLHQNTALGDSALQSNTTGTSNTASGFAALQANTTGYGNTANGTSALRYNTTGLYNTATGIGALAYNTTGSQNIANGGLALSSNTTGTSNTASGFAALDYNTTGNDNTATGNYALVLNTTGIANTANGSYALYGNTTGSSNTAYGYRALSGLRTLTGPILSTANNGGRAQFITPNNYPSSGTSGLRAGGTVIISGTTSYNGSQTIQSVDDNYLFTITTAYSTADASGSWTTDSTDNNTALGYGAGHGSNVFYSAVGGTYVGYQAGYAVQSGSNYNTLVGYSAGSGITTGTNNLLLGASAGTALTTGSNNIALGANTNFASATADSQLQIGAGISGDLALGTLAVKTTGSDSTSAFTVQDHNSNSVLNVDTTNSKVTIGSVTNAASLEINGTAQPTGPELVTNGIFTGSTTGWTLGSNVTYNSATNNVTSTYAGGDPSLSTTINTVAGNTYRIKFDISSANARMQVYTQNNSGPSNGGPFYNGTNTTYFVANYTGVDTIYFDDDNYNTGDTWTLDSVSVKQVSNKPALNVIGSDGTTWLSLGNDLLGNTAIGQGTLQNNTIGRGNTAIGSNALKSNISGSGNTANGYFALSSNTYGNQNTAIGDYALQSNVSGIENTAIGFYALSANTYGISNTAIGHQTLRFNTSGFNNTAIGDYAMTHNTTGTDNTASGEGALQYNTTGQSNTAIGGSALHFNTTGSNNTAIGEVALQSNITGSYNLAIGNNAGGNLSSGSNNVAIGSSTQFASANADNQLQIGSGISGDLSIGTLAVKTTGSDSTSAFTVQDHNSNSVLNVDTTNSKVTIGSVTNAASLEINGTAQPTGPELVTNGIFTGSTTGWTLGSNVTYNSATNNVTSTYAGGDPSLSTTINTVAGNTYRIKFDISSANAPMYVYTVNNSGPTSNLLNGGTNTIAFTANYTGTDTIYFDDNNYITGDTWTLDNVSIKQVTSLKPALNVIGYDGSTWLSLGNDVLGNTALGKSTLQNNTTGTNNTAFGQSTLQSNTTGNSNAAIGSSALQSNTTGTQNAAFGFGALQNNATGFNNIATGTYALNSNTTGNENVANGSYALRSNTTGSENVASGFNSLNSNTTGNYNIASGSLSLNNNTTGDYNIAIGHQALLSNTTGYNNTVNGSYALSSNTTGSDNTVNGFLTLTSNTTGVNNTASGVSALIRNTTGSSNTANGSNALQNNTTGLYNSALGFNAGSNLTTGSYNLALGANTTFASAAADNQLQIGAGISGDLALGTLAVKTTGSDSTSAFSVQNHNSNTVLSVDTVNSRLGVNTSSPSASLEVNNTAQPTGPELITNGTFTGSATGWTLGNQAFYGTDNVSGVVTGGDSSVSTTFATVANQTYIVKFTISSSTTSNWYFGFGVPCGNPAYPFNNGPFGNGVNAFIYKANCTGSTTLIFGSGQFVGDFYTLDDVSIRQATSNVFTPSLKVIGADGNSLISVDSSSYTKNISIGSFALQSNSTGQSNVAVGVGSLQSNIDGIENTAYGTLALQNNTSGLGSTAVGSKALKNSTTGNFNAALGQGALYANTTGSNNTGVGSAALGNSKQGSNNTGVGSNSLVLLNSGSNNSGLGFNAGSNLSSGSNNLALGANTTFASGTADNQLQIGAGISGDLAKGTLQIKTVTNSATAFIIQDTASSTLFTADTAGSVIKISGTPTVFASLTLDNAHFKSTQTTAPTIGTPNNCGVSPTATVTAGSTDTAGSFVITAGTGVPATCDTVFSFNKAYGAAPKSVVITSTKAVGSATAERAASVSAASANNFTLKVNTGLGSNTPVAGEVVSYYYFVIE